LTYGNIRRWRCASQIGFLLVFLFLLLKTEFSGSFRAVHGDLHLPWPVRWFLELDPLVAVGNALATHALYHGLLWSLVIVVPTFFLGRFFCGWICPLGSIHHFFGGLRSEGKRGRRRVESNRYRPWQVWKYFLLLAFLAAALTGSGVFGWFDPVALLTRSLGLSLLPGINYGVNAVTGALYHSRLRVLKLVADLLQWVMGVTILSFRQPNFRQAFLLGVIFVVLLALNLWITRLWCRLLCPLGALLGLISRWSLLGLAKQPANCGDCNRCLLHCQGGDDPIPGARWRKAECHLCLNCTADCPEGALHWRLTGARGQMVEGPDLSRRRALTGVAAGVALVPLLRSATILGPEHHERLLRPPGALAERDFLARCIRCGECMKVCPNNALHPTLAEAGLEGLWSPVLVPRVGYCEPSCTLCSDVCPTGAIWQITAREKGWAAGTGTDQPIRIGTAFYDRGRCLPWAMATDCIVCEEWCPTSPKAIYLRTAEVSDATGIVKQVRQPYLQPDRCVGCGACEFACPVQDRPAIYVTSIGESRSKANQILLRRG
jgi:polyferredoxin